MGIKGGGFDDISTVVFFFGFYCSFLFDVLIIGKQEFGFQVVQISFGFLFSFVLEQGLCVKLLYIGFMGVSRFFGFLKRFLVGFQFSRQSRKILGVRWGWMSGFYVYLRVCFDEYLGFSNFFIFLLMGQGSMGV